MSIKVNFEIGHVASVKSKTTPEGFTHDWELFIRGCDSNIISRFVDKVVFNLHESFPKPKRVVKDPPYIIKESGYAGFNLTIDVYLKNRDEPKKITFAYDLNLQINLPFTNKEERSYIFHNPSSDFRRKLLEGGGVPLTSLGRSSDDRSRDMNERSQSGMTATSTSKRPNPDTNKKHKKDRDEFKPSNTFANLFGTPITQKSTAKVSPDPKCGSSGTIIPTKLPSVNSTSTSISSNVKQTSQKPSEKNILKDKSDKLVKEKKDKTKYSSSPMKENSSKDGFSKRNDIDEKAERREEKRKEKSHKKDRERSKDKSSKEHISPKRRSASPKRSSSPMSRSGSSNRHFLDTSSQPAQLKTVPDEKTSSSAKKAKKEKREKSLDKDRISSESRKEKDCKQQAPMSQAPKLKDDKGSIRGIDKGDSTNKRDRDTGNGSYTPKESKDKSNKFKIFDAKSSPSDNFIDPYAHKNLPSSDSKKSEKHDKDSERKHKHKKKDKNKDKDRENSSSSSSKDRKKEKSSNKASLKDESEGSISTPPKKPSSYAPDFSPTKLVSNNTNASSSKIDPISAMVERLSDASTSESEIDNDYRTISRNDKPDIVDTIPTDHPNASSLPDVVVSKLSSPAIGQRTPDSIKKTTEKTVKKTTKEEKSVTAIKDDKKRKRKTKNEKLTPDSEVSKRTTPSPARLSDGPPPSKVFKKLDQPRSNKDNSTNDQLLPIGQTSSPLNSVDLPVSQQQASDSFTSTSSMSLPNLSNESFRLPGDANNHDYLSELKSLQHKIMALQNNNDLQQVVEMIAATGCYEITNKTFDFDLCALDRSTVQRLQEFFAQTQSGVL